MKLRTSSFNFAIFRKDITRFSPVWVLYSVFLLLALMVLYGGSHEYMLSGVVSFGFWMIVVNLLYALLCAEVLFGDLFTSRMCNALHAFPARRESWFGIHVLSGLCFSLIPNLVFTALLVPGCSLDGPSAPWFLLVQSTLQFLFFFGTAVLCAQLVGSRFAMVVVYGLVNFGAMLIYWLLDTLYVPLLPGVVMDMGFFRYFAPAVNFFAMPPMDGDYGYHTYTLIHSFDGWLYLAIAAGVGAAFGVLALVLYRKRNLETAGDFIAVNWLKPVFLVSYTFVMAAFFQMTYKLFIGSGEWVFMLLGIAVGYFTGQMFLLRSAKVFTKKCLMGFGVFALAVLVSLGLTLLDPLGITRWVPDSEDVVSVELSQNYREVEISDPDMLEQVEQFHRTASQSYRGPDEYTGHRIGLRYRLKNGITVQREYWVSDHSAEGELLRPVISSPQFVLEDFYLGWEEMGTDFLISYYAESDERLVSRSLYPELMACIIKDCEEGNLPQQWWSWNDSEQVFELILRTQYGRVYEYLNLTITEKAVHTVQWLTDHGMYPVS